MPRELMSHKVDGLNDEITIQVCDEPGPGGANHHYLLVFPVHNGADGEPINHETAISFQNGPVNEAGYNGISNEALLAIVLDRLEGFQSGPHACHDNAMALSGVEFALNWLHKRTRDRLARGVEGTSAK